MTDQAFGDVDLNTLLLSGTKLRSDVRAAITSAEVALDIEGAPTFDATLIDPHRTLLTSGIFGARVTAQVGPHSFELVSLEKTGSSLKLTFEHLVVSALRKHDQPKKIAAGAMTRTQFIKQLVSEEPWITVVAAPSPETTKQELARGDVPDEGKTAKIKRSGGEETSPENTWEATGRLADEVGWRRFVRGPRELLFVPDSYLLAQPALATIRENTNGVDDIDFDYDIGQRTATATVACRATEWMVPPGSVVVIAGCGAADGKWLVSTISRSLFSPTASIELIQARPALPEPQDTGTDAADVPDDSSTFFPDDPNFGIGPTGSDAEYIWPVDGKVTSSFGPRGPSQKMHKGIDIGVPSRTPVFCIKDGVVAKNSKDFSGYGNYVIVQHAGGVSSVYAHLSLVVAAAKGLKLKKGDPVGFSGGGENDAGKGNATGPHLHFEIRVNNKAVDPLKYIGKSSG